VLFPEFEVLDMYGPLELWAYVPEFNVITVADKAGPVRSRQGVSTVADYSFANAPPIDILMVPGGMGTRAEIRNPSMLEFLKDRNAATELATSVCTGSALLAKAGLLNGFRATSNKRSFSFAVEQGPGVKWIGKARWVEDGKFLTSSGVSAGMDMSLGLVAKLYGYDRAPQLASSLEYVWNHDPANDPFAIEAPETTSEPSAVNEPVSLALRGLDPVTLVEGREEMGKPGIERVHEGYRYRFVGESTSSRFASDPERYSIQNDSCPVVPVAPVDPSLFVVHEARVYGFATEDCVAQFKANPERYLNPN
jgi:putative intracellular protease/amidase/YHS domain-containing protein